MTGGDVRKWVPLSPIALAVAIGVAAQTLLPLPWSPIESAEAAHRQPQQCWSDVNDGGGFDGGCCNCDGDGSGDGGGDGGK